VGAARTACGLAYAADVYAADLLLLRGSAQIAEITIFDLGAASLDGTTVLVPGLDLNGCTSAMSTMRRTAASGSESFRDGSAASGLGMVQGRGSVHRRRRYEHPRPCTGRHGMFFAAKRDMG
jgi:hypothetical protein